MTTTPPKDNPDDPVRPATAGTQSTIEPTSDKTTAREALAEERELVSHLLYIDAFPDQKPPERPAVAAGDKPQLFGLDGKPIPSIDKLDPKQPVLAESINSGGQREILAYSNKSSFESGKPTARLVLDSKQSADGTTEAGTIFRGNTQEKLSERVITQNTETFELTFQVKANGETQKVVFDGSGLPKQFELTRDGRTLQFKFDDAGNVVDVADSMNPDAPIKEPFRTMFLLAAKQSLADLRTAQGLPEPWKGDVSTSGAGNGGFDYNDGKSVDGVEDPLYQPVSFLADGGEDPEFKLDSDKKPVSEVPPLEVAPAPRVVLTLPEMTDKQLVERALTSPANAAEVAAHLAQLTPERRAEVIKGLVGAALANSEAAKILGDPKVAAQMTKEIGTAFVKELFAQYDLSDRDGPNLARLLNTASGFGKFITADQAHSAFLDTSGFMNNQGRNNAEVNAATGKFIQSMFETGRSDLHDPMLRCLSGAGWGVLSPEGKASVGDSVTGLIDSPDESIRNFASQAIGKLVETDATVSASWLNPPDINAPGARQKRYAAVDALFTSGAKNLEPSARNVISLLEVASDKQAPESVRQRADALLLKMLGPEGLAKGDDARNKISTHLEAVWKNPESRTQLVRDAIYVSSGDGKDAMAGLTEWSKTKGGMPRELTEEILRIYNSSATMDVRGEYKNWSDIRAQIVARALMDIPGALATGAGNTKAGSMSFVEQAARSEDKALRGGANYVLSSIALQGIKTAATPREVAYGRAALDSLVVVASGAGDTAGDAQRVLKSFGQMSMLMGEKVDADTALREAYVRTALASDNAGHRTQILAKLEEQFRNSSEQARLDILKNVLKGFGENVNGPGAADMLKLLDRMEATVSNPKAPADAAKPARTPEQVLSALAKLTLSTPDHPAREAMVRVLTGLSVQRAPYGENENPLYATARAELATGKIYKNPELAAIVRNELEKHCLPQPITSDSLYNLTRLGERVPELRAAVADLLATTKVPDQLAGELVYTRAFARGGLPAVLEETKNMPAEKAKQVLKVAVDRLGGSGASLTREEADPIAELTRQVLKEFPIGSETVVELYKTLNDLVREKGSVRENPISAQALSDAFVRLAGTDGNAQFARLALAIASRPGRSGDGLAQDVPKILARFSHPADIKTLLESSWFAEMPKNHETAREAVAKWLHGLVDDGDPEVMKSVIAYVGRNGLDNFGPEAKADPSELRNKLIESSFTNLKSDDPVVRSAARDALANMVSENPLAAKEIVPRLLEMLGDKQNPVAGHVRSDLLVVALSATQSTRKDVDDADHKALLALLKPIVGNRESLAILVQSATSADSSPALTLKNLNALAALAPEMESERATIIGALVDASMAHDKASENLTNAYDKKVARERASEFDALFKSLAEKGIETLQAIVAEQLKNGMTSDALNMLIRLSCSDDAALSKLGKDGLQALTRKLDSAQLVRAFGEDTDFNKSIRTELVRRAAESPEQKKIIEGLLLDYCHASAGKPSSEPAFLALAGVLANSDSDQPDAREELVKLATTDGPNKEKAFNAILAMALAQPVDHVTSACGDALDMLAYRDPVWKKAIDKQIDGIDTNTVDGIRKLAALSSIPYFAERVEQRLQALLRKHDMTADKVDPSADPKLFTATLDALFRYPSTFLRSVAKPGESDPQVIARLLPHLSPEAQNRLRNSFKETFYSNNSNWVTPVDRIRAAECLVALGNAGVEDKDMRSHADDMRNALLFLGKQSLSAETIARIGQAGDKVMAELLASSDVNQQNQALYWFANRARAGAPVSKDIVDRAIKLVGASDTTSSATGLLLAVSATPGDAKQSERINAHLLELAKTNSKVLAEVVSNVGQDKYADKAAREIVVQLAKQRPELVPGIVEGLLQDRYGRRRETDESILATISDIANANPARTVQALSEIYSKRATGSGADPLNCLARLLASDNSAVQKAAGDELKTLFQSAKNREEIVSALYEQYKQTAGSDKIVPMLVGLFDNSLQFKPDAKQAIGDLAVKAKTDAKALELLAFLAGRSGEAGFEAAKQLQQLAKIDQAQLIRVYNALGDTVYGKSSPQDFDSPSTSLFINITRGQINAPIVTGKALTQNMLELVDKMYKWDWNNPQNETQIYRVGKLLGSIAGSTSSQSGRRVYDFVQKFGTAFRPAPALPGDQAPVQFKKPEFVGPKQPPPTEPFVKNDGTKVTPVYENGVFKGTDEVAPDKTKIKRDSEGRITRVETAQGVAREFTWGKEGFVTRIRETSGVEFISTDGFNYLMRPASPFSPVIKGELSIEATGAYSFKGADGVVATRDTNDQITVKDLDGSPIRRINSDGSKVEYNEHGQITETTSATGQVRKFKYLSEDDDQPSEVTEPNGAVFQWQGDKVWKQIDGPQKSDGATKIGDYQLNPDGVLVFKRPDGARSEDNLDGSRVEFDAQNRPTTVRLPNGDKRELFYAGDSKDLVKVTYTNKKGTTTWERTAVGTRPAGDTWTNMTTKKPVTEILTAQPDGSVGVKKANGDQIVLRPDGREDRVYPNEKWSTLRNPDGTAVTTNTAGAVTEVVNGSGRRITLGYTNGIMTYVSDGKEIWTSNDGKTWHGASGTKLGLYQIDKSGVLTFTSDVSGTQTSDNIDGSVTTRNAGGLITEVVTPNGKAYTFEYAPGNPKPIAMTDKDGRWSTTDGVTWTLDKSSPPKTAKFSVEINQIDGNFIQTFADKSQNIYMRDGTINSFDGAGRPTYVELKDGSYERTTYDANGKRQRLETRQKYGIPFDYTFTQVNGQERLKTVAITNFLRVKCEYTFDPVRTLPATPPNTPQPLVTSFKDASGTWVRRESGSGHIYDLVDGNPPQTRMGAVSLTGDGTFIQITADETTIIRTDGVCIVTTESPSTTKVYNARNQLVETVDYAGLRRRYTYEGSNLVGISEFDPATKETKDFKRNSDGTAWYRWENSFIKEARHGRYELNPKTGHLTIYRGATDSQTDYLERPPAVVSQEHMKVLVQQIHEQLKRHNQDGAEAVIRLLSPLTKEQRKWVTLEYNKEFYSYSKNGKSFTDHLAKFDEHLKQQIERALNRENNDTDNAGLIYNTLTEYGNGAWYNGNRTQYTCATEIRTIVQSLNPEKLEQLRQDYKRKFGKSLDEAILEKITDQPDRRAMEIALSRGPDGRVDQQAMLDLGFEHRRIDLVRDALKFGGQEFRDKFLKEGGEKAIEDRFGRNFWDYVKIVVCPVGALAVNLYDRSRGYGIGSSRDVADLTDHAVYGALSEATIVQDHTHILGDNEEAIELSLNQMPPERRRLYAMGLAAKDGASDADLVNLFPHLTQLDEAGRKQQIELGKRFFRDLEASMKKAAGLGSSTEVVELAHWRDLILHPVGAGAPLPPNAERPAHREPGTIVTRLSAHAGSFSTPTAQDLFGTIENMSKGDWQYLKSLSPEAQAKILKEAGEILDKMRPEHKEECLRLLREKMAAPDWEQAQNTGRRSLETVIKQSRERGNYKPEAVLEALQHMTPEDRKRLLSDETYRTNLKKDLVNLLGFGAASREAAALLVDGVFKRIQDGQSGVFTPIDRVRQSIVETLRSRELGTSLTEKRMKCLNDVALMLTDENIRKQFQANPQMEKDLKEALEKLFTSADGRKSISAEDSLKFISPLMRTLKEGSFPPEALQAFCGDNFQSLTKLLPKISPAARENLVKNPSAFKGALGYLDFSKQQVMLGILEDGGTAGQAEIARAFIIKWKGVDKAQVAAEFQGLDSPARDKACDTYFRRYRSILDADMRKEVGGPMTDSLLARNETPEMKVQRLMTQYYKSADGIGAAFVQTTWDGTPAQARAAADKLLLMHFEAQQAFKALKNNPEFEKAVKGLNDAIQLMRDSKEGAANALNTAILTIVGFALAPVSGGASMFLVAAVIGAAVKVGLNMAIMGADYNARERALSDILTGGLESALNMLGPGHVARIFGMTERAAGAVGVQVGQKFGKELLVEGAEGTIQQALKVELGQAVASGSNHVADTTLEAIAKQAIKPPATKEAVEQFVLLMKNEIKTALAEETKLTVQNLLKEMSIHGIVGGGSGVLSVTAETVLSAATGHGTWDPRLSFEANMKNFLMQAGTAGVIGGGVGSGFHFLSRGGGAVLKSRRSAEMDGLETGFRGAKTPEAKAQSLDQMVEWAHRAPAHQREAAFERVRQTLGVRKDAWNAVLEPFMSKQGVTIDELRHATKLAQAANLLDAQAVQLITAIPATQRMSAIENILRSPHAEKMFAAALSLPDASTRGQLLEGLARLTPDHQAILFRAMGQPMDLAAAAHRSEGLVEIVRALHGVPEGERAATLYGLMMLSPESRVRLTRQLREFEPPKGVDPLAARGSYLRDTLKADVADDLAERLDHYVRMTPEEVNALQPLGFRNYVVEFRAHRQEILNLIFTRDAVRVVDQLDDNITSVLRDLKFASAMGMADCIRGGKVPLTEAEKAKALTSLLKARDAFERILGVNEIGASGSIEKRLRDTVATNRKESVGLLEKAGVTVPNGQTITQEHINQARLKLTQQEFASLNRLVKTNERLSLILENPRIDWPQLNDCMKVAYVDVFRLVEALQNPATTPAQLAEFATRMKAHAGNDLLTMLDTVSSELSKHLSPGSLPLSPASRAAALPRLKGVLQDVSEVAGIGVQGITADQIPQRLREKIESNTRAMKDLVTKAGLPFPENGQLTQMHLEQLKSVLVAKDFERLEELIKRNAKMDELLNTPNMDWQKFHSSLLVTHKKLADLVKKMENTKSEPLQDLRATIAALGDGGNITPDVDELLQSLVKRTDVNDPYYQQLAVRLAEMKARLRQPMLGERVKKSDNNIGRVSDDGLNFEWIGPTRPDGTHPHLVLPMDGTLGPPITHPITFPAMNGDGTVSMVTVPAGYRPRASLQGDGVMFQPPDGWTGRRLHYRVMQGKENHSIEGVPLLYPNGYIRVGEEVIIPGSNPPRPYVNEIQHRGHTVEEPVLNHLKPDGSPIFQTYRGPEVPPALRNEFYFAPCLRDEPGLRQAMKKAGIPLPPEGTAIGIAEFKLAEDLKKANKLSNKDFDEIEKLYRSVTYRVYHVSQRPTIGKPDRSGFTKEQLAVAAILDRLASNYQDVSHAHILP
jgi:YD repeat-containing protein